MHERNDDAPPATAFNARFSQFHLSDGTGIRFFEQGPRGGEPILLLHGYSDSSFSFSRILPLLPADRHAIAPDQRGHGDSDRPDGDYSTERFARDAIELLDLLDAPTATVVGHSMGSFIARQVAVLAPDRVRRLVLVAGGPSCLNDAVTGLASVIDGLTDPLDPDFVREFQESTVHRPVPREFMDLVVRESLKVPAHVWKGAMSGMLDYRAVEHRITCPTLVLGGDRDGVFSVGEQTALAETIPGGRLELFSDVGHALQWEDPRGFVRALIEFVG